MNLDLKIGWNDLSAECKVNIIYPAFESEKCSNSAMNSCYDNRNSINTRTYTSSLNDFIYQHNNDSTTEEGSGAG